MKFPKLIVKGMRQTPIYVVVYGEGLTEDGAPVVAASRSFVCNWQDSAETVLTKEQKKVRLSGVALIDGDIFPQLEVISGGYVRIFGQRRELHRGIKARNPDGTVNYTRLEVM